MERLDLDFLRDQLALEAVLDVRDLLAASFKETQPSETDGVEQARSLIEKARSLRNLARLR